MSAEKEIVNYWLNKQGFFTINNLKSSNRDYGIVAFKPRKSQIKEINHYEIFCSIAIKPAENANIIIERFNDKAFKKILGDVLPDVFEISSYIVISNMKNQLLVKKCLERNIKILRFENILGEVIRDIDKQYYKNDIIRTMQIIKYLFLKEPKSLAEILYGTIMKKNKRKLFLEYLVKFKNPKGKLKSSISGKNKEASLKDFL